MENWKPVVGYEGIYEVSDHGRMRSCERRTPNGVGTRRVRARILKLTHRPPNYWGVSLHKGGHQTTNTVHIMLMRAFCGIPPAGQEVCHNDGDGKNNHISNLRYDTRVGNCDDTLKHGTRALGERHGMSKLTEAQVREIRQTGASLDQRDIAKKFGVSQALVSLIQTRKKWTHIGA